MKKQTANRKILDRIEELTGKPGAEIARDLEITRQAYHQYKNTKKFNFDLVKRLSEMYNLPLLKLTRLAIMD